MFEQPTFRADLRALGRPISSEAPLYDGHEREIGQMIIFEKGVIISSRDFGTYVLMSEWARAYAFAGGPAVLGLPCSGEQTLGDTQIRYVECERGLLVHRPDIGFRAITS